MSELIRTKGLSKSFGKFTAVEGVDLNLQSGIVTSIIGPNGAGKTTLINLLTGMLLPDSGKIFFKGEEITKLSIDRRVKKGIVRSFQIMNTFLGLSVAENVLLPVLSRLNKSWGIFFRADDHQDAMAEVENILKGIGLWEKRTSLAKEISHGDQRLLEISIAIATDPVICFLDEPTAGMNPIERSRVLDFIKKKAAESKVTFIIIEHDMDVIFSLSERMIVMNQGKILAEGEPTQVSENKEVRDIYLGKEF